MKISIGCDPEFFVRKADTNELVSAYGLIPGDKNNPYEVENGAVQVDGMALEFNTNPAYSYEQFENNVTSVLLQMKKMVGEEYKFDYSPVAEFGQKYIDEQPQKARELGCDPDYNAYTGLANPRPDGNLGIRTASGHIHIGWTEGMDPYDEEHFEACMMLTKQLDYYLGKSSVMWDKDKVRASMYGRFGAFRPKSYGVEYRVLSNAWLKNKWTREFVYKAALKATTDLLDGKDRSFSKDAHFENYAACDVYSITNIPMSLSANCSGALLRWTEKHLGVNKTWCDVGILDHMISELNEKQEINPIDMWDLDELLDELEDVA